MNEAFSEHIPKLQLFFDTVSLGLLKECPRKYQLSIVEGWQASEFSPHLFFGLVAHSTVEVYARAKASGLSCKESVRKAIRHCLERAGERRNQYKCPECSGVQDSEPPCLHCNAEEMISTQYFVAWHSDDKHKNRKNLVRTMVWYFDKYKNSTEKTVLLSDGSPAVELWFRVKLPFKTQDGEDFFLTGHIDRLVEFADSYFFSDLKTTKNTIDSRFFEKFMPDNQMYQYAVGGKVVLDKPIRGGIIDAAQIAVDFSRFRRGLIEPTQAQLNEWLKDVEIWLGHAEDYARANYWPMNDKSCGNWGGCPFRSVCNKDPAIRGQLLRTHFVKREWRPLVPRERTE